MKRMIRFAFVLLGVIALARLPSWAETPVEMLQSALDAYFGGRYDESVHYFERIVAADPKNVRARSGLKNARRKREEQIRKDRDQERKSLYAAESYLAQGKRVEAFDRTRDILSRTPNLPDGLNLAKKIRLKTEKLIQKSKPGSSAYHEAVGDLAYMDGDWFKAVDSWEKVLVFNKDRADLLQRLAVVKKKMADQQKAERIQVLMGLAKAHMDQGFHADALKVLGDVLQADPTNADARIMLNDARRAGAQAHQAKLDGEAQELNQKAVDAYTSGRRKEALALFEKVLAMDPENRLANDYRNRILGLEPLAFDDRSLARTSPTSDYARAQKLLGENKFVEAIEILERRLDQNANDLKAQQLLDEARQNQRDLSESAYREALTAYSRGDRTESIRLMQESRRVDPNFARAKMALLKMMQEGNE